MKFEITGPCDEDWDEMVPREGGRYCARCETVVLDLALSSRAEAERRVAQIEGESVCVQLRLDRFGEAVFVPPPRSRAPHFVGGLVLVAALGAGGCAPEPTTEVVPEAARDPGPPMIPTPAVASSVITPPATPRPTRPVPADELPPPTRGATPTAEQRALTAQKQRAHQTHYMVRGVMPLHRP